MDIGAMSISMNQGSLKAEVQLSVMKLSIDSGQQIANQMAEMMNNVVSEPEKGINLDIKV